MNKINNTKLIFVQGNLYPYNLGGHEVFNYYFYEELKKDCNVKIISYHKRPKIISFNDYIKVPKVKPISLFFSFFCFFKLLRIVDSETKVILTFSRTHWINWCIFPILKKITGLKYIIIIHGGGLAKWKWSYPFLQLFKNSYRTIGISERIVQEYSKRTGVNIKKLLPLIPFSTALETRNMLRNKWNFKNEDFIFLIVGSLKPLKNPFTVISAIETLGLEYIKAHNIRFVFSGDGPLKEDLINKIKVSNFEKHVVFLGNVERKIIPELYKLSDGYIISSDFEGTPLSLLEAIYNKLVVIASDSPGINNIISNNKNGLLYKLKDAIDLSNKIKIVRENDNSKLVELASETLKKDYDFFKVMEKYKLILDLK